jgi:hypothetical protein
VAIGTTVLFAVTFTYEWGYFSVVGPQFQTFATATDYVSNAVLWLPYSTGIFGASIFVAQIASDSKKLEPGRKAWRWKDVAAVLLMIPAVGSLLLLVEPMSSGIAFTLIVVWILAIRWAYLVKPISWLPSIRRSVFIVLYAGPIAAGLTFLTGSMEGHRDLRVKEPVYVLKFKDNDRDDRNVVLLRNFERGILANDVVQGQISFIRWDDVREVSRRVLQIDGAQRGLNFRCKWLGLSCPPLI